MLNRFCRSVFCRFARNAALVVLLTCLFSGQAHGQTGNVVVSVNNISIAGETSLRGLTGAFPYPVLSTISVTDQAGNVIIGLADTARFIGPAEIAEIGAPISQVWQPLLEYHRDNPAFPANQNLFNQTPQPSFTEVRRTTYFPTSTMLVMDISGSMKPQLEEAKASNLAYLEQLRSYDRAGLIQFCASVVKTLPISSDLTTLRQEIAAADTCTGTAIENALLAALEVIRHETTRRGIIIYTDGQNFPFTEPAPAPVIALAQTYNIPIFTIALGDQTREDILQLIAEQTGGLFFSAETAADMVEIYEKIAVVIQNFYVMAHASPDPIRNNTWRVVDVTGGTLSNRDRGLGHYFVASQSLPRVTDLALSLTASTETARPGDTFEYLLRLSNSGLAEGRSLDLKQYLPDSVRFLGASPAPLFGRGDSLFWQIPALPAGNTFDIRVSVQLSPQTPNTLTELISHARLSSANDSSPDNNFASDTVRVIFTPPPNNTELAFSISSQTQVPGAARAGEAFSYSIRFNNLGAHAAQNIRVAQILPDSVRFLASSRTVTTSGDSLIWQIPAIPAGGQDSVIVNVQLTANVPPTLTQLISFANFTADNDTTPANNFDTDTLRVIHLPPLGIVDLEFSLTSQTQVSGEVRAGETFFYKIKFNNPHPKSAENIRVAQILPDSVRFLSSMPASGISGDSLIWQIAAIDAGAQDSIIVNVQLAANVPPTLTELISFANFTADNDTTLANNFDTDTLRVISQPPLGATDLAFSLMSQTQVPGEARTGEAFSYQIKLNNVGANAAQNIRVAHILPDSVRFLSSSQTSSASGDSLIWQIPAIAVGGQDSIIVNVQLAANVPPALTQLISLANFTADNDTTLSNNFDSDTLRVISQPPLAATDLAFSLTSQTQVPGEARTGEAFSYQIRLNNIGVNAAQNVRVAHLLPDSVRFLSSSRISSISGDSLIWQIPAIDAGAQDSIIVNVQLAANVPPTLTQLISFANFTADNDTTPANNSDSDTLRVISQPPLGATDLAFSLTSQTQVPGEARTGEVFSYQIKLNNVGVNAAQNVRVAHLLPDSVRFLSSSQTSSVSGDSLIWQILAIPAGAQDSITVNVQLAANVPPTLTQLISFANFTADNDTTPANNFDSDTLRVISQPPLGATDLAFSLMSQTQVPGEARTGEAFSYQIKLNNVGVNSAQNIRVAQILPDSVRFLSSIPASTTSGDSLIWQIAAIDAGAQDSIIVNVQLAANVPPTLTELISFANFTADNDTTLANNSDSDTLRVISQPPLGATDLAFSLTSQTQVPGEARTGEAFSYQIKLHNVGVNAAQNIRVAQILPDSVRFLSSSRASSVIGDSLIWQIPAIPAGAQDSIIVNVQLAANVPPTLTQLISFANFTADNDTTLANNFDTDTLRVISQPPPPGITDLAFSLTSQTQVPGEARTGEAFSYQIRLNNVGMNAAQNVRVAHLLPDSVRFLSSSRISSISGDSLIWQIAAIAAGSQDSITVNVQLAANVPPTLTELVSFANFTADNDTTPANNFDSDTLRVISLPPLGSTDLAFSLTSQTQVPGEARTGEAFSYQIKLHNVGANAAQNIRVAQILPDSVRFLSSSRISTTSGDSLIWQIAAIAAGSQDSITVNVQLAANVPPTLTELISFANFTADNDTTLANNFDSDTLRVISQPPLAATDLAFSLTSQTQVPGEVRTGEAFSYQIKLNNVGVNAAQNVRVAQILPDSVRFLSSSRASSASGDSLIWQIPAIPAGAQDSIIVNVQLAANVPPTLTQLISFANFTADNDTTLTNNFDTDTLRVISQPPPLGITDLAFSLTSQTQFPGEARTGETFSYQIKLNNVGANAGQNIRVAQILPDSVRFFSASQISTISGDSLIWQIAAIASGSQDSIVVNVQLAANVPPTLTELISFANFTADNDTTLANNFDTDTLRVISQPPPLGNADLAFSLTSQTQVPGEARTGEAFSYQIKLNNVGANAAQNVRIAHLLPDSVRFLSSSRASSASGDSLIWQIAAIDAGAQDSIIVNVQLAANVPPTLTELISFANFTADNDTTLANNSDSDTLRVISQPPLGATDLAFSLTSQTQVPGEARTGEAFLYQIKLHNVGANAAQNIRVAQILPDSVRFLSSSRASSASGDSLIWQIPAIPAGAQDSIIVNVQLAANVPPILTQLISFANFTADNDTTLANNSDSDTLRVISQPPLGATDLAFSLMSQTQVPGEARTGEAFSYQIRLNNVEVNAAQNVRVAQILPDSVRFLSSIPASTTSGDSLIWQIAAIAAGSQDSITVNVQLAANVPPTLTQLISFANFTADNDTTLANNFDTDTLRVISQPPLATTDLAFALMSQTQVPGEARTGEAFSYNLLLSNVGANAAQNVRVAQILPDSVRFLSSSRISTTSGDSLIWQIAAIAAGSQDSIIVNVQLAANVPPALTELISFANFTADNDTTLANNFDTDTLRVISQPPLAATDLAFSLMSQTQVPGEARTGEAFSYNLLLSNVGANAAQNIRVAQILPDSVRYLSSSRISSISGDSLVWQIAAIAAGSQDSIIVNVQLAANVPPALTELISFANFTADNDTTLANNFDTDTLRVISQPPLAATDLAFSLMSQTQVPGEARTGEAFSYNLLLSNVGANAAQNVRVAQILPDSVRFLSSSRISSISGDSLIWQIAAIAAGSQDSIIVNVQLAANVPPTLTELISLANFTADNDTTIANNSDSDTLRVISQPPPPIVPPQITATPPMVQVGDSVFIRVQVEQAIQKWDLWVYFVTGAIDSSFADGFIAGTPLTPQIWYDVHPAFSETKLLTAAQQERIEFELHTIDSFGRPASSRASVTVRAGNALVLDRNVYEAERQGPLAIKFRLSSNRVARLDLLDLNGQKVTEIIQAPFSAGWNTHFWNGLTQDGRRVGSGVYVVTLHSQDFNDWKKVIVVR